MNQLNRNQILAIIIAVLAVLMGSTAQLTDLLGPSSAKLVLSLAALLNGVLSAVLAVLSGQTAIFRDVAASPGVTSIRVNSQASPAIARLAVDPTVDKIGAADKQF